MTTRLSPAEFTATVDKISKINERAAKRGFTGRLEVTGERVEVTTTDLLGFKRTEVFFEASLTGEAPSYGGWTFLARVDSLEGTFTLATAPGVESVDRSAVRPGDCDHCGHDRQRKTTYLVVNDETGETRNVGSTCIKDFLGWTGSFTFYGDSDVSLSEFIGGFNEERTYSVETVLAYAYAATRAFGWVAASSYSGFPTVNYVRLALFGVARRTMSARELRDLETLRDYADEAQAKVTEIKAYILSDDFAGTSTYVENLKAATSVSFVTARQIGLLASAPQALTRHLDKQAERKVQEAKAATVVNEFLGQPKDKVTVTGTIESIRFIEGQYGTTVLYTILTDDMHLVKWFASREALGTDTGRTVTVTGTVKGHDEYREVKSTVLTRCKELAAA